ncbi:MAG: hypothetical protein ACRDE8_14790, partial [Ginsengibacter sp.]
WVVEYAVSIKKFLSDKKLSSNNFDIFAKKIFSIPYLKKWKIKYFLALRFPNLFEFLIQMKERMF